MRAEDGTDTLPTDSQFVAQVEAGQPSATNSQQFVQQVRFMPFALVSQLTFVVLHIICRSRGPTVVLT